MIAALLATAAGLSAGYALFVDRLCYAAARRAVREGQIDLTPFAPVQPMATTELGANPDVAYGLVAWELDDGEAELVWTLPPCTYAAATLYTPWMQSVDGGHRRVAQPGAEARGGEVVRLRITSSGRLTAPEEVCPPPNTTPTSRRGLLTLRVSPADQGFGHAVLVRR